MKKIVIPAILTATILVAGMFAFMPVEKAGAVHTTILGATTQTRTVAETAFDAAVGANALVVTCNAPFNVNGLNVSSTDPTDDDSIAITSYDEDGTAATFVAILLAGFAAGQGAIGADPAGAGSTFPVFFGPISVGTGGTVTVTYTGATAEVDVTNAAWSITTSNTATCS